ncbi:MAG: hypothetical protein JO199_04670 [Candidatus Eremiobacteraeota bacterium]|nr:hypothetical protein [Candidatus Eremiobacteraeota bacterium]
MTLQHWPRVVHEDDWQPGLPPPIEALRLRFPADHGWQIDYGTLIAVADGAVREAPVAVVRHDDGRTITFFPESWT